MKKKHAHKMALVRQAAAPPAAASPWAPRFHPRKPWKKKSRNAGVGASGLLSEKSPIVPILAGAGGAVVASIGAEKMGMSPNVAAWSTAALGAATALGTSGTARQVATGVGAAGVCLGAVSLVASWRAEAAKKTAADRQQNAQAQLARQAESSRYITREELNDALARAVGDAKRPTPDPSADDGALAASLRAEVKQAVNEAMAGNRYRGASGDDDDYARNAYGDDDDSRNADGDDDSRNADGDDDYARNAFGDDDDSRNADGDDDYARNAYGDDET